MWNGQWFTFLLTYYLRYQRNRQLLHLRTVPHSFHSQRIQYRPHCIDKHIVCYLMCSRWIHNSTGNDIRSRINFKKGKIDFKAPDSPVETFLGFRYPIYHGIAVYHLRSYPDEYFRFWEKYMSTGRRMGKSSNLFILDRYVFSSAQIEIVWH